MVTVQSKRQKCLILMNVQCVRGLEMTPNRVVAHVSRKVDQRAYLPCVTVLVAVTARAPVVAEVAHFVEAVVGKVTGLKAILHTKILVFVRDRVIHIKRRMIRDHASFSFTFDCIRLFLANLVFFCNVFQC